MEAELVLESGRTNKTATVSGVPDILDDGPQQFAISVGPCSSDDARFNFDWVRGRVAFGWNEDHGFPLITKIEPTQSAILGESVTINGRNLDSETSVCVNGWYVSGPPDYRVSLAIVLPSGDATMFEVVLRSPAAVRWFQNVSGTEYRPYAPRPCPQLAARRRSSVRIPGVPAAATATATGSAEAKDEVATAAANGIDIKSIRFGVIDTTAGPTANASSLSTDMTDARTLNISGTLSVADLEFKFTAFSKLPTTEPLMNQARTEHYNGPTLYPA